MLNKVSKKTHPLLANPQQFFMQIECNSCDTMLRAIICQYSVRFCVFCAEFKFHSSHLVVVLYRNELVPRRQIIIDTITSFILHVITIHWNEVCFSITEFFLNYESLFQIAFPLLLYAQDRESLSYVYSKRGKVIWDGLDKLILFWSVTCCVSVRLRP